MSQMEPEVEAGEESRVLRGSIDASKQEFTILSINMSNENHAGDVGRPERRNDVVNFILGILSVSSIDFVLVQELLNKDANAISIQLEGRKEYVKKKSKANRPITFVPRAHYYETQTILNVIYNPDGQYSHDLSDRLSLINIDINGNEVLIASWHGPNEISNKETRNWKLNDNEKIVICQIMCNAMMDGAGNRPWIVGGDFNISHEKILEILPDGVDYRADKEERLYFLHTNSIEFTSIESLKVPYNVGMKKHSLDHYPLLAKFRLSSEYLSPQQQVLHEIQKQRSEIKKQQEQLQRKLQQLSIQQQVQTEELEVRLREQQGQIQELEELLQYQPRQQLLPLLLPLPQELQELQDLQNQQQQIQELLLHKLQQQLRQIQELQKQELQEQDELQQLEQEMKDDMERERLLQEQHELQSVTSQLRGLGVRPPLQYASDQYR